MNGKERMVAALTDGLDRDFPVVIPYPGIFLRDHWDEVTDKPWWSDRNLKSRLEVEEDLQNRLGIDWVQCWMCPPRDWRKTHKIKVLESKVFMVDVLSGEKTEVKRPPVGGQAHPIDREPLIKSIDDIELRIEAVREGDLTWSGRLDYARMIVERFGSERFVYALVGAPYWSALTTYMGFKGIIKGLFKTPKLVESLLEKVTEQTVEKIRAYTKVGVDGIWIEDCLCSANEISLAHFERFALPYAEKLISEIKRLRMKSIYYFCGDVHDRLERIVETGPDAISLEESLKGFQIDIDWIDRVVGGRACIFGNLDVINILTKGGKDELEREIKRQIRVGRRSGKFVMSLGSSVTPDTSLARVREYVEIARRLSYGYHKGG